MSRTFTIKELNEKIDKLIAEYEAALKEPDNIYVLPKEIKDIELKAMINALEELKLELNSPEPLINVTQKIQESLNIIETNKIIKDGL